jgi:hypothetical protein
MRPASMEKERSVEELTAEARKIAAEEEYTLEVPARQDRPNAFAALLDEEIPAQPGDAPALSS